jgi:hypothetical protein
VEFDLVRGWTLDFFGSLAVGGGVGFLVARLATFELGMGAGLLVPGIVSLSCTLAFVSAYRELAYDPARAVGTVVAVEDRPANASGSITSPVAIVEYAGADGVTRRVDGPRSSSLRVDDEVVVVPHPGAPNGVRIGRPRDLFGGTIASMLFGTFPFSAGIFFLVSALARAPAPGDGRRGIAKQERSHLTIAANLLMFCGVVAIAFFSDPVAHAIMLGFGVVSLGLWLHVAQGLRVGRDLRWTVGLGVLAVNFSAWVAALWLLTDPNAGW